MNHALLFDLDGTLIDSAPDLEKAVNAILEDEALAPLTRAEVETCLGDGLRKLLIKTFALRNRAVNDNELQRLMPRFEEHYSAITPEASCIYPGVVDFLREAKARGVKLGVCTNKYEKATLRILDVLDLANHFGAIVGGDTVSACKPDPLPLTHALKQLNAAPQNALMLGDHINDVLSARGAGMKVVGVDYGYSHAWPAHATPDAVVKSFSEYPALIPRLLNGF